MSYGLESRFPPVPQVARHFEKTLVAHVPVSHLEGLETTHMT